MRAAYRALLVVAGVAVGIPAAYCLLVLFSIFWTQPDTRPPTTDTAVQCVVVLGLIVVIRKAQRLAGEDRLRTAVALFGGAGSRAGSLPNSGEHTPSYVPRHPW